MVYKHFHGIATALSSDAPATSWAEAFNPFVTIQAAVTRTAYDGTDLDQDERVSVEQALKLYTVDAKSILRMKNVGQLKAGYDANFVILGESLGSIPQIEIMHVKPLATYIDGECVFKQETIRS